MKNSKKKVQPATQLSALTSMFDAAKVLYVKRESGSEVFISVPSCYGPSNCGNGGLQSNFVFSCDGSLQYVEQWESHPEYKLVAPTPIPLSDLDLKKSA